jgi:hypothetical protein
MKRLLRHWCFQSIGHRRSKVSIQEIADLFRLSGILRATAYCDLLKLSQKWSFGDLSDDILCTAKLAIGKRNQANQELAENIVFVHLEVKSGRSLELRGWLIRYGIF